MGLFDDPAQYFGHLNDELLRATRLVVDTGMHAKGWTREQSIKYMREPLGYDEVAKSETERYMAWPGQALGYPDSTRRRPSPLEHCRWHAPDG